MPIHSDVIEIAPARDAEGAQDRLAAQQRCRAQVCDQQAFGSGEERFERPLAQDHPGRVNFLKQQDQLHAQPRRQRAASAVPSADPVTRVTGKAPEW